VLAQNRNDLLFREPNPLHRPSPLGGRTLTPRGGKTQWQVSGKEAMEPQVAIVNYYHKMTVLRAIAAYRCPLFSQL
jgi:hypothetical protein